MQLKSAGTTFRSVATTFARSCLGIRRGRKACGVGHQMKPSDSLAGEGPADLASPGFDVRGRPGQAQEGHPLVVEPGHVAEAAPAHAGVVLVVVFLEQLVEAGAFAWFDHPRVGPAQPGLFGAR